ncbi:MAG: hypothetical protein H0U85_01815 [Gemmatimonadales bacterium]|nr:hypothetical protein [Gemmatimonadales bacterium]
MSVAAIATAACGQPEAPSSLVGPAFVVGGTSFQLDSLPQRVEVRIPFRLVNATGHTLYLDSCFDRARLEREVGEGVWTSAWADVYACVGEAPRAFAPNDSIVDVLTVTGSLRANTSPRFDIPTDTIWHYRLRFPLLAARQGPELPVSAQTVSPTFTILP